MPGIKVLSVLPADFEILDCILRLEGGSKRPTGADAKPGGLGKA